MHLCSCLEELLPSLFRVLKLEAQAKHVVAAHLLVDVQQDLHTLQDLGTALDIPAILALVIQEDLLRLVWPSHILQFVSPHLLLQFAVIPVLAVNQPLQSLLRFQPLEMVVAVTANQLHLYQPTWLAAKADHMVEVALMMPATTLQEKWNAWIKTSATFQTKLKIAAVATVTAAAIPADQASSWKNTVPIIFRRVYKKCCATKA